MPARIPTPQPSNSGDPSAAEIVAAKRRVVKISTPEPLSADRKYVGPSAARSAVTYDLFTWAAKHNRTAPSEHRRVKVSSTTVRESGMISGSERAQHQRRLRNYFEFGAGNRLRARSGAFELNVHRNRILFVTLLCGILLYSLSWLAS